MNLNSKQRKYLRSQAHHLTPIAFIGKNGFTKGSANSIEKVLAVHELIKLKFNDCKDEKYKISQEVSDKLNCSIVGIIGNITILYREQSDKKNRKYKLPE